VFGYVLIIFDEANFSLTILETTQVKRFRSTFAFTDCVVLGC